MKANHSNSCAWQQNNGFPTSKFSLKFPTEGSATEYMQKSNRMDVPVLYNAEKTAHVPKPDSRWEKQKYKCYATK